MLFNTVDYALFFAVVFTASWALARWRSGTARLVLLLGASYWFYGHWDWRYVPLVFGASSVNFLLAHAIDRSEAPRSRKALLGLAVAANLGLLGVFKYWHFAVDNGRFVWSLLSGRALTEPAAAAELLLPPVGISFFTFVALGYVIDVYRRRHPAHASYLRFLVFVTMFPHLVAGPIVRGSDLLPQLERPASLDRHDGGEALLLIAGGLLKKVVIADQLALQLVDRVFDQPTAFSSLEVLAAVYGYAIQIYCDFSGYTDIAIGSALLLGVRFPVNFDSPYKAQSVAEFWRRWHISLSNWLRDYLFAPLGGAMGSRAKSVRNLVITMLLGGLWHGAAWTFVLWGLLHGLGLAAAYLVQEARMRRRQRRRAKAEAAAERAARGAQDDPDGGARATALASRKPSSRARKRTVRALVAVGLGLATFHYVCFGWIFFRAPNMAGAVAVLRRLAALTVATANLPVVVLALLGLGFATHLAPERLWHAVRERFIALPAPAQAFCLFLVAIVLHEASSAAAVPFVYFQF